MLLVGVRLSRVMASHDIRHDRVNGATIDLWLIDETAMCTHITVGLNWCLIVEAYARRLPARA